MEGRVAQREERIIHAGVVGLRLFDDATEALEHRTVCVDDAADFPLEWDPTEPAPPRDADALEVAVERRAEARAVLLNRERRARVGPGNRAQEERDVGDGARHGPGY
jgi:hypothetical protein